MKTRTFILSLMMMFCSVVYGQNNHWNPNEHLYSSNMNAIISSNIEGVTVNDNIEIAAFFGDVLRGSVRFQLSPEGDKYLAPLTIFGEENHDVITFKLYDHSAGQELTHVSNSTITYSNSAIVGSIDDPVQIDFILPVAKVNGVYYSTLTAAVAAAQENETVTLLKSAEGAGLKINESITVDLGGFTYTINEAVGSTGTESQGFQLLKENEVTITNGEIEVVDGTHVVWMFNSYANLTLSNLTVDCANMDYADGVKEYAVVANNGGGAIPEVTIGENVVFENFTDGAPYYVDPGTTLVAPANLNVETVDGYVVVYNGTSYTAVAANVQVKRGGEVIGTYATLQAAIDAAVNGDEIVLLDDIAGNASIKNKKLTLDGGNHNLNGTISTNVTTSYPLTFKNFDIKDSQSYFVKVTGGGGKYYFYDCNISNGLGLIYTQKSTHTVDIVDSSVDNCTYGVGHFVALNVARLENVTVTNSACGLMAQNQAETTKKINFIDCNISATEPVHIWVKGTEIVTFSFEGENEFVGTIGSEETTYGKFVLTELDATLKAQEGLTVESGVEGYVAGYEDGVYSLIEGNVKNINTNKTYATLQAAINAAQSGETISIVRDHELTWDGTTMSANGTYAVYALVENKTLTIDLNGKIITVDTEKYTGNDGFGIIAAGDNGELTLTDSSEEGTGAIDATGDKAAILLWSRGGTSMFTINAGNYYLEKGIEGNGMVYAGNNEIVVVNGGKFILGNVGTGANGSPWIFNVSGQNQRHVNVNGGTFNADIVHQYYCFEVEVPETKALRNNGDGTWTIVDAVAYVKEKEGVYENEVGYETVAEAYAAAESGETITLLKDVTCPGLSINKDVTIDLNGKTYTINEAVGSTGTKSQGFQLLKDNEVTIKNGNIAVVDGTHVVWMFNSYANLTLSNLTVDCANMDYEDGVKEYAVVANNGGGATPTVTIGENVVFNNFADGAPYYVDPGTTLEAGSGLNVETVDGYVVVYNGTSYTAVAANVQVKRGGEVIGTYATLQSAINAAANGDEIVLLNDMTEDVTIENKKLTLDGGNHNLKGTISTDVTTSYPLTFKNFDIIDSQSYFVKVTGGGGKYYFYDCNISNGLGLIYTNKSTHTVDIVGSRVDNCTYGVGHFVALNVARLENVTVTNSACGLMAQNQAETTKKINFIDCNISATEPVHIWVKGTEIVTFSFEGENEFVGTIGSDETTYGKFVLTELDATLKAQEGLTVESGVEGYVTGYENGVYSLVEGSVKNISTGNVYATLQAAIDAADDGNEIVLLKDITVDKDDVVKFSSYETFFLVKGKSIAIDLNGKDIIGDVTEITANADNSNLGLIALFTAIVDGELTINDNVGGSEVKIETASVDYPVYSLISSFGDVEPGEANESSITINGGSYYLNAATASLFHSANGNSVVYNGTFILGNVGTGANGSPWIFNTNGQNAQRVTVNGGTYNYDINHQAWDVEVYVPYEKALQYNGDAAGTWTVVESVAYVEEKGSLNNSYYHEVGYATLAEAVAAIGIRDTKGTVTMVKDVNLTESLVIENDMTIDLATKAITSQDFYPTIRIINEADVTVTGEGSITNNDYVFVLGAQGGTSSGNLTIENGTYQGVVTVASVTKGNLVIEGGEFSAAPWINNGVENYNFLINCVDTYYPQSASVSISGGKFHNWNPENNAAEGPRTNFCAEGYGALETSANVWEVFQAQQRNLVAGWNWFSSYINISGTEGMESLQNALGTNGVQIKNNNKFTNYTSGIWDGLLKEVSVKEMYMINVTTDQVLQLAGEVVDPSVNSITLAPNWNWIGYQLNEPLSLADALAGVDAEHGDHIKTHNGFAEYFVNESGVGTWWGAINTMTPGLGYMYFNTENEQKTLTYSYPTGSKSELKANVTSENNYWAPMSSRYANNMNMIAIVEGNKGADFEVAAFVNGEVRGSARPIYVEPLDAYMLFLTIHGEGVEEMTFQYYDLATGEEYTLGNRMNYSDDAYVGSINEPYVLMFGTTGIGEASMSEFNVYPNPTTIGKEVSLGATCETVEVFNVLGVKIAEYQNVDSIDAFETAGIYVIRVTNDNVTKHCRLVVK